MMRFPGINPMIDGETMHGEDGPQGSRIEALATQYKTMGTLPHPMMLTLLRQSLEYVTRFGAYIVKHSHLSARPSW